MRFYLERHARQLFAGATESVPEEVATEGIDPEPGLVRRAAEILRAAERPVVLVGSQSMSEPQAAGELAAALGTLGAPVYLAGMARGLLGAGHALQCRHTAQAALQEADVVIVAGVPFDFRLDYGRRSRAGRRSSPPTAAARRCARTAARSSRSKGDAGRFLRSLATELGAGAPNRDRGTARWATWLETLRSRDREREAQIARDAEGAAPDGKLNPLRSAARSSAPLPRRACWSATAATSWPPRRTSCARAGR